MENLHHILKKYWGFDSFRPLQEQAIASVLSGRDTLVVLPTGGGKSLCFQAPAVAMPGLAVVISPLISLMKDQVDHLTACGVPAACMNSSLSSQERRAVEDRIREGSLKLLYVAPERLVIPDFLERIGRSAISFFAIDEAHCISSWGHDFRPEYRRLQILKGTFPDVGIHAYTATATAQVRDDIIRELHLQAPEVLVGSFDRPNLQYRVERRGDLLSQVVEVIARHPAESGIIYCISRKNVDELCEELTVRGHRALPYHAGMDDRSRKCNQEAFVHEQVEIIVATVAFGMGIDKPNIRYVIHTGIPKSLEHYVQESGRAGRDGLPAECCLLFSDGDLVVWRRLLSEDGPSRQIALRKLDDMADYCHSGLCRHKTLVSYFGEEYAKENCTGCDNCQGVREGVADSLIIAQKILSCVIRLGERVGAEYTTAVLTGSREPRVIERHHDKLSTWGILSTVDKSKVRGWIDQLAAQKYLERDGEFRVLRVTDSGRRVLKGETSLHLTDPTVKSPRRTKFAPVAGGDSRDTALFEHLRTVRRRIAEKLNVPPFVVFADTVLRDLSSQRPTTTATLRLIRGIGERKIDQFGEEFLRAIREHAPVETNDGLPAVQVRSLTGARRKAADLFKQGRPLEEVARLIERAPSTVSQYLAEFIQREGITDPTPWVDQLTQNRIRSSSVHVGLAALKPIFEDLKGEIPYDTIRLVVACLRNENPTVNRVGEGI
ncbi:MAG: DNA helicase RecQ [candidate division Zixibacteria bacterium]|nr:DNA helicase RecQ [candidate division Zixibacteria bacterium]